MPKAVIFDYDMTLANTSALERYRQAKDWKAAFANVDRVRAFKIEDDDIKPHQLPGMLIDRGYKVGIVTASPSGLAEKGLTALRVRYHTLVGWHDTKLHKPDPDPINLALSRLGCAANETVCVGDSATDVEAGYRAGCFTVGAAWGVDNWSKVVGCAPDVFLHNPSRFLDIDNLEPRRYATELWLERKEPIWHRGSLLWLAPDRTVGFALGRYYPTGDTRHAGSRLSQLIIDFKDDDGYAEMLAGFIADALNRSKVASRFSYAVCAPPKPKQSHQRFKLLLEYLRDKLPGLIVYPDGLKCVKDYGSLKALDREERAAQVKGAFASPYTWNNKGVLLIDDVLTTGATSNECAAVLRANAASEVLLIGLGKDQWSIDKKICPNCGRPMKVRHRRRDNAPFWGCTGYGAKANPCDHAEDI